MTFSKFLNAKNTFLCLNFAILFLSNRISVRKRMYLHNIMAIIRLACNRTNFTIGYSVNLTGIKLIFFMYDHFIKLKIDYGD